MSGNKFSDESVRRIQRQTLRAEDGEFNNPPRRGPGKFKRSPTPRVVMLLEDCQSGDRASASILVEVVSSETQILEICGEPISGTFALTFQGQTTNALAYDVSAADMQSALEGLSNISPGDVVVEIGPAASAGSQTVYRWLVSFTGQFDGEDVPQIEPTSDITGQGVATTIELEVDVRSLPDLEDSGETVDPLCVVPLPPGVVIPAGAVGIAMPVPTFGYCLVSAECRDCDSY